MNIVEYNESEGLVEVRIGHRIYAAPIADCVGYPEDFFENASVEALESIGFEFAYGLNAY